MSSSSSSSSSSSVVVSEYTFKRGDNEREVVVRAGRAAEFPEDTSTAVRDETGHVAWQAMPVLCHFILSEAGRRLLRGAKVLELGAGIGVPGLLAGRVCGELVLTDNNDAVVERLRRNVELNRADMSCAADDAVRVLNVAWGADSFPPEHILPRHAADVILGSDVVYSASSARAFLETAKGLMAQHDGVMVLAYIPRWPSVDRALHDSLREEKLTAEVVPLASFLPADGELSPDNAPLPKGTCLLLVRPDSFHHGSGSDGTSAASSSTSPDLRTRKVLDEEEEAALELRVRPEHLDDSLPEACRRAGVDAADAAAASIPPAVSVEVDATGPISVTPVQVEALSRAFCAPPLIGRVSELRLKDCWLGNEGWSRLGPCLSSGGGCAQTLSLLSATGDEIDEAAASTIARMLPHCKRLGSLCLTRNPLGDAGVGLCTGASALGGGLATCHVLTSLVLSNCAIGDAGASAVASALPTTLLELDLSSNEFSALGLADVATALRLGKTPALTHLNISGNEVGPGGGAELGETLPVGTPALTHLDLRGCFLMDSGVTWLTPALPLCKEIAVLHLSSNGMGDNGVTALARALPLCGALKHLGLAMNCVTGDGAWALVEEMVHEGSALTSLNLKGNSLGDEGASAIADVLADVPSLEVVNLAQNAIDEEGGMELADALSILPPENRSSLTIILEGNPAGIVESVRSRLENICCAVATVRLSAVKALETGYGR